MNIKPQDWHNTRLLEYIPKHFTKFKLGSTVSRLKLLTWIEFNTSGRYAIAGEVTRKEGAVGSAMVLKEEFIAFEEPADATMYSLFYK